MRRNITRLLLASALPLLALAPRPAEAGPLCEPPPDTRTRVILLPPRFSMRSLASRSA